MNNLTQEPVRPPSRPTFAPRQTVLKRDPAARFRQERSARDSRWIETGEMFTERICDPMPRRRSRVCRWYRAPLSAIRCPICGEGWLKSDPRTSETPHTGSVDHPGALQRHGAGAASFLSCWHKLCWPPGRLLKLFRRPNSAICKFRLWGRLQFCFPGFPFHFGPTSLDSVGFGVGPKTRCDANRRWRRSGIAGAHCRAHANLRRRSRKMLCRPRSDVPFG